MYEMEGPRRPVGPGSPASRLPHTAWPPPAPGPRRASRSPAPPAVPESPSGWTRLSG